MGEDAGRGDATAQAEHEDIPGGGMSEERQVREQELGWHVRAGAGVDLAVDAKDSPRTESRHGYAAALAVTVEEHFLPGYELAKTPPLLVSEEGLGIDGGSGGHHALVPSRQQRRDGRRHERGGHREPPAVASAHDPESGRGHQARDDRDFERRVNTDTGYEHEPAQEHTGHRAPGADRVEPPDLPADGRPCGGRGGQGTGKGRPDADRDEEERSHAEQKIEDGDPARSVRPAESHEE